LVTLREIETAVTSQLADMVAANGNPAHMSAATMIGSAANNQGR
jgi:hypothetical protein